MCNLLSRVRYDEGDGHRDKYSASAKLQQHVVQYTIINCCQCANNMPIQNNHKIFTLSQTEGKYFSSFEILHSDECKELFSKIQANIASNNIILENLVVKRKATYMIYFSHLIYSALRNTYGFAVFHRKTGKGKWTQTVDDCSENDE